MSGDVIVNPNDPNAKIGEKIWRDAGSLCLFFKLNAPHENPVILCLASMLLSVRTAKQRRGLSEEEFIDQVRDVWKSEFSNFSDEDLIDVIQPPRGPKN